MAKIFGIYDTENKTKSLIKDMFNSFGFGEPDYVTYKNISLGHIKIKSKYDKGIAEDKDTLIAFCGSIFGYEDDFHSLKERYNILEDTAEHYILHAYKNYGLEFLKRLNGVFNIAIYEKKSDKLFLITDRYASKPLYYYIDDKRIIFASEIKAIIKDKHIRKEIEWDFWKDYFSYGYALGDKTPFKNIYSLSNGMILGYYGGKAFKRRYWDYDHIKINHKRTVQETVDEGVRVLRNVFQRQVKDMDECILLLSGGYDSRCIACSLKHYTKVKFETYSIRLSFIKQNDATYAKMVADALKLNHREAIRESDIYERYFKKYIYMQDGLGSENLWIMPLVDILPAKFMNLDGIAGDVFLKGGFLISPTWAKETDLSDDNKICRMDEALLAKKIYPKMTSSSEVEYDNIKEFFDDTTVWKISPDTQSIISELKELYGFANRVKTFQIKNRTRNVINLAPNNLIVRRAYSLMPFFDNEFAEFALSIPVEMKIRKNVYQRILSKAFPEMDNIPTTNDITKTRDSIRQFLVSNKMTSARYTIGMIRKMLRREEKKHKVKKLSANKRDVKYLIRLARETPMPSYIKKAELIKKVDEYISQDKDPSKFLIPILQFCMWHEMFYK